LVKGRGKSLPFSTKLLDKDRRDRVKRRIVSTLVIFIGLLLLAYPKVTEFYNNYQQQELIKEWQQSLQIIDNGSTVSDNKITPDIRQNADNEIVSTIPGDLKGNDVSQETEEQREEHIKRNVEGMLKIEKIDLNQPILKGAVEENLKISVASIEHTGEAGEFGNYAIAGHRSHTYGRNFNRLEEVEVGDVVEVDKGEKKYKYTIVEKLFVKPEETWVLNSNKRIKEITLVTCHPMIANPTHRLIIKGRILD